MQSELNSLVRKANRQSTQGFTLVEMAFVIVIFGLIVASFSQIYSEYIQRQKLETTKVNVNNVASAIGNFRTMYGRYPCPASLTDNRNSVSYGRETSCTNQTINPGQCSGGICVQERINEIDINPDPAVVNNIKPRVRVGFIPFRELGLEESEVYDGYDRRLMYVVTERLAVADTFNTDHGGIEITNENGNSIIFPPQSAHFTVFSYGRNQAGSYGRAGDQTPCPVTGPEMQNCNLSSQAVFTVGQISNAAGSNAFDDTFKYSTSEDVPLWQISQDDKADIHQKPSGKVGLAIGPTTSMTDQAVVNGVVRITNDPMTTTAEGGLKSSSLCDLGGQNCFATSKISGSLAQGGGLRCSDPAKPYMVGIVNGQADCAADIVLRCPNNTLMKGIDDKGNIICDVRPPIGCPSQSVTMCTGTIVQKTRSIPARSHGSTFTVSTGASYQQGFTCNNGTWISQGATGVCTCTQQTETRPGSCGLGFTGTAYETRTYQCPQGTWSGWVQSGTSQCTCDPITETIQIPCPAGTTGTPETRTRQHTCNPSTWSAWQVTVPSNCVCANTTETRTLSCPAGFRGTGIVERRNYTCGANPPWGPWVEQSRNCTCEEQTQTEYPSCPPGFDGDITRTRTFQCPAEQWTAWQETQNTCQPLPPVVCTWASTGNGNIEPFRRGQRRGSVCASASGNPALACGQTGACHESFGPGNFRNYDQCYCQ
jgi:prepilin-type N-terminal cleavage/methylation domain-containing protein